MSRLVKRIRKILLIYPPWYRLFGEESPGVPLGLAYIGGTLEKDGYDVTIYNADSTQLAAGLPSATAKSANYEAYLKLLCDLDQPIWHEIRSTIVRERPDLVGVSLRTAAFGSALNVSRLAKAYDPEMPVVWGGVHPTVMPEESARCPHVDIVVRGEGEETILDIMRGQKPLEEIQGITYRDQDGKVVSNPERPLIMDLDSIPFPARERVLGWRMAPRDSLGGILSSRGCPFKCVFCASHRVWSRKVRYRTLENVMSEIKHLREHLGLHRISFEDDIFPMSRKWLASFADAIRKEGIKIRWKCETRVDLLTDEMAEQMKESGCDEVFLGLESGSPETLRRVKKGITVADMRNAVAVLRRAGLRYSAFLMIGFPWETVKEMQETLDLMRELQPFVVKLSVATPYPGTDLHQICAEEGILPDDIDWSTCFPQSPQSFFSKGFTGADARRIINEALSIVEQYNRDKKRRLLIEDPMYVVHRVLDGKYYTPKRMWSLARHVIGQAPQIQVAPHRKGAFLHG